MSDDDKPPGMDSLAVAHYHAVAKAVQWVLDSTDDPRIRVGVSMAIAEQNLRGLAALAKRRDAWKEAQQAVHSKLRELLAELENLQ